MWSVREGRREEGGREGGRRGREGREGVCHKDECERRDGEE